MKLWGFILYSNSRSKPNSNFLTRDTLVEPHPLAHLGTHFFWLATLLSRMPPKIMTALVPKIGVFASFVEVRIV